MSPRTSTSPSRRLVRLRILAAPLAALVAIAAGRSLVRFSPRALLGVGSALLAFGSIASAIAPTFALRCSADSDMGRSRDADRRGGGRYGHVERARGPHASRGSRPCRCAGSLDHRHAAHRRRRRAQLAARVPRATAPGGAPRRHRGCPEARRRTPHRRAWFARRGSSVVARRGAGRLASFSQTRRGQAHSCSAAPSSRRGSACLQPRQDSLSLG